MHVQYQRDNSLHLVEDSNLRSYSVRYLRKNQATLTMKAAW